MFLNKLYSEPSSLFKPIVFHDGVNFIFGKKEANSSRESLNGIGKSTVLELLDFCLCSEYSKTSTSRLFKHQQKVENFFIVLEFEVDEKEYTIRRSSKNSKQVELSDEYSTKEYDIKAARQELFNIIFYDPNYVGCQNDSWYRSLMAFFLKIHKKSKNEFIDPIQYLTASNKLYELNQFHLYLMGIDNTVVCENFILQNEVKDKNIALREVKRLIERTYRIDIDEANKRLDRLQNEITKTQNLIESFKLAEQHKNVEERLNILTIKIKELSESNFWDNVKLNSLNESIQLKDILSDSQVRSVQKLYNEISIELSLLAKKSLNDAIDFRKNLSKSREEFLRDEIDRLNENISEREYEIKTLDEERATLFKSLKAKSAFNDLTQAFLYSGELQNQFSDLGSKVGTYKELVSSKNAWKVEDARNSIRMGDFVSIASGKINDFKDVFNYVYESIYPSSNNNSSINISQSLGRAKHKIEINVSFSSEDSKGRNKGRTLIYDLAIMLNIIERKLHRPRFLVHDGIFDGMDKAHFVDMYHFVQNQQIKGNRFQYIITLNEEGTLSQDFGATDELTPEKISEDAIVVLTPNHKLLNL